MYKTRKTNWNCLNRKFGTGIFMCILICITLPAAWSLSYVQSANAIYYGNQPPLADKEYVVSELAGHFDGGEFAIQDWDSTSLTHVQSWIDVCDDYNFTFIFCSTRYPGTYKAGEIPSGTPGDYRAVRLNPDGTFTTLTGDNQYDIFNPDAAAYRASKLAEKLAALTLAGAVYFEFNEDSLTGYMEYDEGYLKSYTYSDADLASFRNFLGDQNAKFPVSITNIPTGSQYKIVYTPENEELWDDWRHWRFAAFADYLDTMAEAVYDTFDSDPCYMGAIYFGSNSQIFEVSGMTTPALSLDEIADSSYIVALVSETAAGYFDIDEAETAAGVFKQTASSHGKEFGMFVQLWNYGTKQHVSQKDVSIQLERNHKYGPDIVVAYPSYVFLEDEDVNPLLSYTYNPPLIEFWDSRENLTPPGSAFRHADFDWGSPVTDDADSNPSWILDYSCQVNGYFDDDRSSYRVDGTESNWVGYVRTKIDRNTINGDVTFTIDYTDYASAYMYVQLRAADWSIVINNLTGNILTGTGNRLKKEINIPLKDNPTACWILVARYYGDYEVFYTWIDTYPGWLENGGNFGDDTWINGFGSSAGSWDSSSCSWKAGSGESNYTGYLKCALNRTLISEDITLTLDYTDYSSSYMYIQLRASNWSVVVNNLTGNFLTGTGERLTKSFNIPLHEYPAAAWILVDRFYGNTEIFSMRLDNRNPWLVDTSQSDCTWDTGTFAYDASGETEDTGSYTTRIDLNTSVSNSLTMVLDYTDTADSDIYVKLTDEDDEDVVSNVTGDLTGGTNNRIKKRIPLYLDDHPGACNAVVQRHNGQMELFPPVWDLYPAWFLYTENLGIRSVYESNGSWDYNSSSYCIDSGEPNYTGHLKVYFDRAVMNSDVTLTLDYQDNAGAYIYIQLRAADWSIVVNNLTGNILTGTGQRLTNDFEIPLSEYPEACWVIVHRYYGDMEIFSAQFNAAE